MAEHNDKQWDHVKSVLTVGTRVRGTVRSHEVFGVLVDLPNIPFDGIVQITDFKDSGRMCAAEYPAVGSEVQAIVLGFKENNHQIWLGMKPSQLAQRE